MRFLADRAVGHRPGLEALHDRFRRLDLFQRDRVAGLELEQPAQRAEIRRLLVHELGVRLEGLVAAAAHRLLQAMDGLGVEQVILAIGAPLVLASHRQRVPLERPLRERRLVAQQHLLRDHVRADAADARGRPAEVLVDHVLPEPHRLEHLRAAVALKRGNAHLGGNLDHALGRCLDEVLAGGLVVHAGEQAFADHVLDGLEGEVGIDRADPVADQQREVVHFARLAGLEHQACARAQALADQVVVQSSHRHQRRNRREFPVYATVAQDQHVALFFLDQAPRHEAQFLERLHQALLATRDAEQDRQHADLEAGQVHAADLGELLVGHDRPLELQAAAVGRLRIEQVALRTEPGLRRRDQLLADAVDRTSA